MRSLLVRLAVLAGLGLVALGAGSALPTVDVLAIGLTAVLLLALAWSGWVAHPVEQRIGMRARAHRESLTEIARPRHPRTAGRRQARAPAEGHAAAS